MFPKASNYSDLNKKLFITQNDIIPFKKNISGYEKDPQKILDKLLTTNADVEAGTSTWQKYFDTLGESEKWQQEFVKNNDLTTASLDDVSAAQAKAKASAIAYNESLEKMTIGAKAGQIAMSGLAMVGNAVATMAISMAINAAITGLYKLATAAKRAKETAEDFTSDFKNTQKEQASNISTISELSDEYDKLSSHVDKFGKSTDLTSEEMSRYHEICNQVADIMPELVDHYDEQGNAVLDLADKYDTLTEAYAENRRKAAEQAYSEKDDDNKYKVDSVFTNYKNVIEKDSYLPSKGEYENKSADFFKSNKLDQKNQLDEISKMGQNRIKELLSDENQTLDQYYQQIAGIDNEAKKAAIEEAMKNETSGVDIKQDSVWATILKNYGLDKDSTDEEIQKAIDSIESDASKLETEIKNAQDQLISAATTYAQSKDKFKNLDDNAQQYLSTILGGLTPEIISKWGMEEKKGMESQVNSLINSLQDDKNGINQALDSIMTDDLTSEKLNPEEIAAKYEKSINTIKNTLGLSESEISDMFNVDDFSSVIEDYRIAIENAINNEKFKDAEGFDWDTWFKDNSINTSEEIQRWNDIAAAAESAAEARAKYTMEELPSIDTDSIVNARKQIEALKTALSTQSSNGYLSQTDIQTLLATDPNMEAALTDTVSGMKLDPEKVKELTQQNYALRDAEAKAGEAAAKMKLDNTQKEMVKLAGSTEKCNQLIANADSDSFNDLAETIGLSSDEIQKFTELQGQSDTARQEISTWQQIQSEIRGATSLLKQYNDAQSTPKERSSYQSVVEARKTADELYKNGWYQDDQLVAFAKLIAKNGATEEEAIKDLKKNEKKNGKYLTEDSAKGVNQFVKDAIAKGAIRKETDKKGNEKLIIDSMEELANAFGMSTELADYLIRGSNDSKYNFDIEPINEYTQALKEVDYDSDGAVTAVENVIKQMQAASDSGEDVSDTIDSVNKAIEELENQDLDTTELRNELDKLTTKGGGVDLQNRPQVSGKTMQESGWDDVGNDETATVYSSSYSSEDGKKTVVVTPILPNGEVLSPEELDNYAEDLLSGKSDKDGLELRTYIGEDSINRSERYAEALHLIQEQFYLGDEAGKASLNTLQDYTAEQLKSIDLTDKGVENGEKQLTDLLSSLGLGKESANELIDALYDMGLLKVKPEVDTSEADQAVEDTKENAENSNPEVNVTADTSEADKAIEKTKQEGEKPVSIPFITAIEQLQKVASELKAGESTHYSENVYNPDTKEKSAMTVNAAKDQYGVIHYTANIDGVEAELKPVVDEDGLVTYHVDNSEVEKAKVENEKPTSSTHTELLKTENQTTNTTEAKDNTGVTINKAVNNINGKKATISVDAATGVAQGKIRKLLQYIAGVRPKINVEALTSTLRSSISNVLNRNWSIKVKANVSGMPKSGGNGEAAGTLHPAHAGGTLVKESGTAYNVLNLRAHAQGTNVGLQNDETALINEVGTEAIVRNGQLYEIPGGTHFQSLKRGDVIINAAQWAAIKKYGSTSSFAGKAYANGTLNATGIPAHFDEDATGNALDYLKNLSDGGSGDNDKDKNKKKKKDKKKTTSKNKSTKSTDDYLDWIEIKISRIEDAISNLDRTATSAFAGWSSRLSDLNSEISKTVEEIDIQTKGAARYEKQAASVGLKDSIAKLVRNGTIDITKYDDKTKEKISDYQTWWDKAVACRNAIEELKEKEKELYKQKFEDVATKYEGYITAIENASNRIDELISQDEQKGLNASEKYYQAQQTYQKNTISNLKSQRDQQVKELADMLKKGQVVRGSEAWYEMTATIDDTTKSIMEADTKILELQNDIRQLNWDRFDSLQDKISNVNSEAEFLVELMGEHDLFTDEGKITDRGTTTMGLYSQEYNTYMNQADRYASEIKKLNAELAKDENKYNKDLIERRDSLVESQQSAIQSAQKMKQSIKSLVSDGFDKEISHLGDLIDKYEEALDSQKDLYDYQDTIKDKTSEIAKLERQIEVYSRDTSEEGRLNLQKAQSSLKDAKKDLESTQMDKSIEVQKQLLSDMQDDYHDFIDEKLKDIDKIVNDALDISNSKSADIWNTIASESKEVGYGISDQLKQIWENTEGKDVVKGYNEGFLSNLTTINGAIQNIDKYLNDKKSYEDQKANENIQKSEASSGVSLVDDHVAEEVKAQQEAQAKISSSKNNPYGKTSSISGNIRSSSKKKYIQSVQWTMKQLGYYSGAIDGKWNSSLRKALMSYQSKSGVVKSPDVVGSKTKGAFKKDGYKTGVYDLKQNELAWTQEGYNAEAIIRKSDGAILTPLMRGDSVLNSDATKNMYSFFNDPNRFVNMPSGATNVTANNTFNNSMTVNMRLDGIKDYDDLIYKMQHDPTFEKLIQAMTVDQLTGSSSLKKYRY